MPNVTPLLESELRLASHARNQWHIVTAAPFEEVIKSEYWLHVSQRLRGFDEIIINADDGSYHAKLLVAYIDGREVKLIPTVHIKLDKIYEEDNSVPEGYDVRFAGRARWRVIRVSDGAVITENLPNREAGLSFIKDKLKG